MAGINDVLADNRAAVLDLVAAAERSAATWTAPRTLATIADRCPAQPEDCQAPRRAG